MPPLSPAHLLHTHPCFASPPIPRGLEIPQKVPGPPASMAQGPLSEGALTPKTLWGSRYRDTSQSPSPRALARLQTQVPSSCHLRSGREDTAESQWSQHVAPEFWRLLAAAALSSARPLPSRPPIPDNTKGRGRGHKTHHLLRLLEISSLGGAPSQGASSSLSSWHRWAPTPRHRHASHPVTSSQPPSLAEAAHRCRWPSCPGVQASLRRGLTLRSSPAWASPAPSGKLLPGRSGSESHLCRSQAQ